MKKILTTFLNLYFEFGKRLIITLAILFSLTIVGPVLLEVFFLNFPKLLMVIVEHDYGLRQNRILLLSILILLIYILKSFEEGMLPDKSKYINDIIIIFLCFWYLFLRNKIHDINGIGFEFKQYSFISLYYLDFLLIPGLFSLIRLFLNIKSSSNSLNNKSIWVNDKPLKDSDNEDFGRKELIKRVAKEINNFSDEDCSFSIGILGPWGSGKTSFIKVLSEEINKIQSLIIDFNPWQYPEETNLTHAFLLEIENQLSRYSYSANRINNYISQLFKGNTNWWGTATNFFIHQKSVQDLQNCLKKSIINSKRKLVIFIDDIDRLQANEIYEVLTIIRNVGNLPNTVFVLAYDKDYLIKSLKDKIGDPQGYLSKFFQIEVSLSIITEIKVREELAKKLRNDISDFQIEFVKTENEDSFMNADNFLQSLEIAKLIKNKRDIIKLMNAINTTWPILKNSLIFKEYFQLEILRLKYGNIYSKIKFQDRDFLIVTDSVHIVYNDNNGHLSKMVENTNDRDVISNVLTSLFPNNFDRNQNKKSVNNVFKFDAYFQNEGTSTVTENLENFRIND